ncbi:MAG: MipA/OmpV family protein, partial [Halobacteriovoraceae bacterium]|nr:MipA/OmpV family protein [Halobacteriovoraceae bacterium]
SRSILNLQYSFKVALILISIFHIENIFCKYIDDGQKKENRKKKVEDKKSNLELGAGLFSFKIPHYRGSDQMKNYFIPMPFFIYTSKHIEAEPSFIRGTFFKKGSIALKLSILAGLSVESETNRAREGMPDLGFTLEAGPMILVRLWTSPDKMHYINFESPFRYVFELDIPPQGVGLFTVPYLNFVNLPRKETWNWGIEFSIALQFADESYHNHYYAVGPDYVRPGRPQYTSKGGYNGHSFVLIFTRRFKHLYLMPFLRYDSLRGVVFEDSPLVKKKDYFIVGMGSFWMF